MTYTHVPERICHIIQYVFIGAKNVLNVSIRENYMSSVLFPVILAFSSSLNKMEQIVYSV
jgi:hypothetical protein